MNTFELTNGNYTDEYIKEFVSSNPASIEVSYSVWTAAGQHQGGGYTLEVALDRAIELQALGSVCHVHRNKFYNNTLLQDKRIA